MSVLQSSVAGSSALSAPSSHRSNVWNQAKESWATLQGPVRSAGTHGKMVAFDAFLCHEKAMKSVKNGEKW